MQLFTQNSIEMLAPFQNTFDRISEQNEQSHNMFVLGDSHNVDNKNWHTSLCLFFQIYVPNRGH